MTPETNPRAAGVIRLAVGAAALLELVTSGPRLFALGSSGLVHLPYFSGLEYPGGLGLPILVLWMISAACFTAGAWTPWSGGVLTLALVATLVSDQQLYSNHLYLMALAVPLLVVGRSGSALSIDAWVRGRGGSVPAWAFQALQVQLVIVYVFSVAAKLNPVFVSGSVVATSLRIDGPLAMPTAWRTFSLMFPLAISVILLEALIVLGLLRPRLRPLAFVMGLALHGGTIVLMDLPFQLLTFSIVMIAMYFAFVTVPVRGWTVVWDDGCGVCEGWVRAFRRLDWLGALRFVPRSAVDAMDLPVTSRDAAKAMQVITPTRRVRGGFAAVAEVASTLPLTLLWAGLLEVPPIRRLGSRAYDAFARRRRCRVSQPPQAAAIGHG